MADPQSPPQPLPATPDALAKVLDRRPVLWVGVGLSIAAGYPSARELVEAMAKEADDPIDTSKPFFAIADAFVASMGKGQLAELLQRFFRAPRTFTAAHRAIARLASAGRFHAIITTSSDPLLELALTDQQVPYRTQPHENGAQPASEAELYILKIDGSYDEWLRLLLSGQAEEKLGQRYPFHEQTLHKLLLERPALFVGSSLTDSRLLDWIASLPNEEIDALKPWRALLTRQAWDAALAHTYELRGAARKASDAIARARIRPLLLDSYGELPGLLTEVADAVAPAAVSPGMKLRELRLRDFRGFRELTIAFPDEPISVLVGVNGAGKSSVLDGIAILLSRFAWDVTRQPSCFASPGEGDIREGTEEAIISAEAEMGDDTETWRLSITRPEEHPYASLGGDEGPRVGFGPIVGGQGLSPAKLLDLYDRLSKEERTSVPVLCRYPASRALTRKPAPRVGSIYSFRQLHAYDKAFEEDLGPFQDLVQWFRLEEDIENEARARGERLTSPTLDAVRAAVERFMSALPGERFSSLRAERSAPGFALDKTSLVIDKGGQRLALSQLSDGERSLILLVSDVARRLAIANPGRPDPLSGSGIVLIDEIELHLHPGWQRAVLPGLRRAFPGLQIIVATHSPQVLSRVPAESVVLLSGFQVEGAAPRTYGRDTNTILEEVMAVPARPEEMAARLKEVGRLIDGDHLVEARAALDQIAETLGATDSEVVRLETLIAFLGDGPASSTR